MSGAILSEVHPGDGAPLLVVSRRKVAPRRGGKGGCLKSPTALLWFVNPNGTATAYNADMRPVGMVAENIGGSWSFRLRGDGREWGDWVAAGETEQAARAGVEHG